MSDNDPNFVVDDNQGGMGGGGSDGGVEETYDSLTERELAFKLLAAHALVDKEFYFLLKEDPESAARSLHIALDQEDYDYIRGVTTENGVGVEWERIDQLAEEVREALHADTVVRSLW
jgi:IS5 family transposase